MDGDLLRLPHTIFSIFTGDGHDKIRLVFLLTDYSLGSSSNRISRGVSERAKEHSKNRGNGSVKGKKIMDQGSGEVKKLTQG